LDSEMILGLVASNKKLLTVEENALLGGFGSQVLQLLEDSKISGVKTECIGLPDKFIEHGTQELLRSIFNLDSTGIAERVKYSFPELSSRTYNKQRESVS